MDTGKYLKFFRAIDYLRLNNSESIEALEEIERLESALIYANSGLKLAYDALEKGRYDEAMLHIGHHLTKASETLEIKGGDNMVLTKLDEVMIARNLTPEALAAKSLMSTSTVRNAQRGRGISLNTGKRIAIGLKMKLDELI